MTKYVPEYEWTLSYQINFAANIYILEVRNLKKYLLQAYCITADYLAIDFPLIKVE